MGIEIEKKFLLVGDGWRGLDAGRLYRQGYLNSEKGRTVRVRLVEERGYLTIKGPTLAGGVRAEYEYEIPFADAVEMLDTLCLHPLIEKRRYHIRFKGFIWEVDEFFADNKGLIVAEIELSAPDELFEKPPWIGKEVTDDPRYTNAALSRHPYGLWLRQ
ncbi:MAG: CYTH domain-containing protein [Desulfobulbaceae bacterium]|jgi:CYTH domain-containing protein|nr:CYTH domain-containing protein [Desulfobulbaceae bacterium]